MLAKYKNSYFAYFLMYNFYFLSYSLFSTLISVYLLDRHYSAQDVSLVVSLSFFTSMLLQPFMGMLNDKIGIKKVTITSFVLVILGALYFLKAHNLLEICIGYSFVLMFINAVNPVLDSIAATSPFKYGKIRIWGTIGYATGIQIAGLIYRYISPQAIFITFIGMMFLAILGTFGIDVDTGLNHSKKNISILRGVKELFSNKTYWYFILITALYSGVTNAGHTYIPAMLKHNGLPVDIASTIISISVICEAPLIFFSYLFMDKFKAKTLLWFPLCIVFLQYLVYGFGLPIWFQIIMTLIAKHAANMILIMVTLRIASNLVDHRILMTALAIVQSMRSLGSIVIQSITGLVLDRFGYHVMSLFWASMIVVSLILIYFLKLPQHEKHRLFS